MFADHAGATAIWSVRLPVKIGDSPLAIGRRMAVD